MANFFYALLFFKIKHRKKSDTDLLPISFIKLAKNQSKRRGKTMKSFAIVSEQGPRRYMEDRWFFDPNFAWMGWIFGGVYDGHGGEAAAEYVAQKLHKYFGQFLSVHFPDEAFIASYQKISDEIKDPLVGATAANFLVSNGRIYFANAGDARIIIVREKGEYQLTTDHRVELKEERQRILKAGGEIRGRYVFYEDNGLMPTRSIGDRYFNKVGVIARPAVGSYEILPQDRFLIAATDGLFDILYNYQIGEFIRNCKTAQAAVQEFKKEALDECLARDNTTIIVVEL